MILRVLSRYLLDSHVSQDLSHTTSDVHVHVSCDDCGSLGGRLFVTFQLSNLEQAVYREMHSIYLAAYVHNKIYFRLFMQSNIVSVYRKIYIFKQLDKIE